jgi:hypothetical protein
VVAAFLLMALVPALAGCRPPRLAAAQPSAELLGREVLGALRQRNESRLRELAVDGEEFRRHVWPGLPAARPERNVPVDYVWGDLRQKSELGLRRTVQTYGGQHFELRSVKFAGPSTDYGSYRIHRETVLVAVDAAGRESELRLLGSMLELNGQWKVYSYVVDH